MSNNFPESAKNKKIHTTFEAPLFEIIVVAPEFVLTHTHKHHLFILLHYSIISVSTVICAF